MIGGEVLGAAGGKADFVTIFAQRGMDFRYDDLTAEGVYVMVPVEITNVADELQMMTGSVLKVVDSEGQEHAAAGRLEHVAYVWVTERWMDDVHGLAPARIVDGARQGGGRVRIGLGSEGSVEV